jgi:hypothetical protein
MTERQTLSEEVISTPLTWREEFIFGRPALHAAAGVFMYSATITVNTGCNLSCRCFASLPIILCYINLHGNSYEDTLMTSEDLLNMSRMNEVLNTPQNGHSLFMSLLFWGSIEL